MRKVFRVLLYLAGIFMAVLIAGSILLRAYSTDIQKVVVKKLNEQLNTKVEVGTIRYSFFRHFPYLSASFQSVTIMASGPFSNKEKSMDPLLKASNVVLDMNIVDALLYKRINIKRIIVLNGNIHLIKDRDDLRNWDILKKKITDNKKKTKPPEVRLIRIINTKYSYEDRRQQTGVKGRIKKAEWNGGWWPGSQGRIRMRHDGFSVFDRTMKKYSFPEGFVLNVHTETEEHVLKLNNGKITWSKFPVHFSGIVRKDNPYKDYKIQMNTDGILAGDLVKYLDHKGLIHLKNNRIEGKISFEGILSGQNTDPFRASASIHITGKKTSIMTGKNEHALIIKDWKADINYDKEKSSAFSLHLFPSTIQYGNAKISAEMFWKARNKKFSAMNLLLNGKIRVDDLYDWAGDNFSRIVKNGNINVHVKLEIPTGMIQSRSFHPFSAIHATGRINFRNLVILHDSLLRVGILETNLVPGKDIEISGKNIKWAGKTWKAQGKVRSFPDYLEGKSKAVFYTNLQGSSLDIGQMLSFFHVLGERSKKSSHPGKNIGLPLIESRVLVDTLRYKGFTAEKAKCFLLYNDPVVSLRNIGFRTMEGEGTGQMEMTLNPKGPDLVKTYLEAKHINVHMLFYAFDNFGQKFIRAENLKGYVSGNVTFQALYDTSGKIIKPDILSDSYVIISDGELIDFKPLFKLSKYIKLSELKDIRFSTLKNEIFIHDQQVVIPDMQINSSALNLSVSGIHHFDGEFDYRIGILLSDYLARKTQKANKDNTQFGVLEEDNEGQPTLFLRYWGDNNYAKVIYDKKRVKKKISNDLIQEKQQLKAILQKETGLFRKDTAAYLLDEGNRNEKKHFKVEWPEEKKTVKKKKKDTTKAKKFKVIWEEEPDTLQKK